VINGEAAGDRSGWSVSSAGDVNGSPALETEWPLWSFSASPLITKPRYKATLSAAVADSDSLPLVSV
jgi:hypothetical protein